MAGFKTVVRGVGVMWAAGLAMAAWHYTPSSNAVAASSNKALSAAVAGAPTTTAGGPRVVYQGAIVVSGSQRPIVAAIAETAPGAPKAPHVWQDVPTQAASVPPAVIAEAAVVQPVAPAVPVAFARLDAPRGEPRAAPGVPVAPRGRVDLNTASVAELNALGGGMIGRAIVAGRPYRTADDLVAKRVLTRATFAQIKGQISAQ